jgi:hypothetical protein
MRPRTLLAMLVALAALVVPCAGPRAAHGQVLVVAERDLDFGMLTAGITTAILPTDLVRSAQLRIEGRGTYQVSFQLPPALSTSSGEQIPLMFAPTDGQVALRHRTFVFDPNSMNSFRINSADGEARINLGGRAQPAPGQTAGVYSATIVMMVVQTGT